MNRTAKPKRRDLHSNQPCGLVLNRKEVKNFKSIALENRNVEYLYLRENELETFDPYIILENLKVLDLSINRLSGTIDFLANTPILRHLYLTGNKLDSLQGVCGFSNLETLCLSDNVISSFEGLDALPNLRVLSLNFNNIQNFRCYPFLPSLHTLNLVGNPIVELPSYRAMAIASSCSGLVAVDGEAVQEEERQAVQAFHGRVVYCISEGFVVEDPENVDAAADKFLLEMQRTQQQAKPLHLCSIGLVSVTPTGDVLPQFGKEPVEGTPLQLSVCLQDIRSLRERSTDTFYSRHLFPVQFKVCGDATEAFCVGSMNGWTDPIPLERCEDGNEIAFQTTLYLPAGSYEYRYIVDGQVRVVETNPAESKFGRGSCNLYHVAAAQSPEEDQDTILHVRWLRSDDDNGFALIDDENALSYTPTAADIGYCLRAEVLAYVKGDFSFLYFDISRPVVAGAPTCRSLFLEGEVAEGSQLTVHAAYSGGEEGSSSLTWFRVHPSGEEERLELEDPWAGYTLCLQDIGCRIRVEFVPVRSDWVAGEPRSEISPVVVAGVPVFRSAVVVGHLEEDSQDVMVETVYSGGVEGNSKFQWFRRDDEDQYYPLHGETNRTYHPTLDDVGKILAVDCTPVSKDGVEGEVYRTVLEVPVEPSPPQIVSANIKGELDEQHVLVVEYEYHGGHSGSHLIQWFRRDEAKRSTKVGRANTASLTTTVKEVGCFIDVVVTPVRSDGVQGKPVTASTTGPIRPGHPQVKYLSVGGEFAKGKVLEVNIDYFGGEQGDGIVEWSREVPETRHFDVIAKRTKKYVVQQEDVGRMLKVSYTPVRKDGVQGETKTRLIQIPQEAPEEDAVAAQTSGSSPPESA